MPIFSGMRVFLCLIAGAYFLGLTPLFHCRTGPALALVPLFVALRYMNFPGSFFAGAIYALLLLAGIPQGTWPFVILTPPWYEVIAYGLGIGVLALITCWTLQWQLRIVRGLVITILWMIPEITGITLFAGLPSNLLAQQTLTLAGFTVHMPGPVSVATILVNYVASEGIVLIAGILRAKKSILIDVAIDWLTSHAKSAGRLFGSISDSGRK